MVSALGRLRAPPTYYIALIHERLGDRDRALESLSRAIELKDPWVTQVSGSAWDAARGDPRFVALMRKTGLTPSGAPITP